MNELRIEGGKNFGNVTPEERLEIGAEYRAGTPVRDIQVKHNLAYHSVVRKICQFLDIPPRTTRVGKGPTMTIFMKQESVDERIEASIAARVKEVSERLALAFDLAGMSAQEASGEKPSGRSQQGFSVSHYVDLDEHTRSEINGAISAGESTASIADRYDVKPGIVQYMRQVHRARKRDVA